LLCLAFAFQRADLDDPAGVGYGRDRTGACAAPSAPFSIAMVARRWLA